MMMVTDGDGYSNSDANCDSDGDGGGYSNSDSIRDSDSDSVV